MYKDTDIKKLVSFIIPIYNGGAFIERAICSILSQPNVSKLEIIIIDDGSTDNSSVICEKYMNNYSNISLYKQDNRGVGAARNSGLSKANGEYIAFLDADDFIEPNFFTSEIIDLLNKGSSDIFEFSFKSIIDFKYYKIFHVENKHETFNEKIFGKYNYSSLWKHLFKKTLITDNDIIFSHAATGEDLFFTEQCFFFATSITYIDKTFYNYVKNKNSVMHNLSISRIEKTFILHDDRYDFYKKYGINLYDDCNYQRILLLRKLIIALFNKYSYKEALNILFKNDKTTTLKYYKQFKYPKRKGKDVFLYIQHPKLFYLKCRLFYKSKERITKYVYKHKTLNSLLDFFVYKKRGYIKIKRGDKTCV